METKPQQNIGNIGQKVAILLKRLYGFLKKNMTQIGILVTIGGILATVFFAFYDPPEKADKTFRKNQRDGKNQLAVRELPAVQSFLKYLDFIEARDTIQMWNKSSYYRRSNDYSNTDKMMYDYFLTSDYQVKYIVPIKEENKLSLSSNSPTNEHTFSFYAILEFEDDVKLEGEVDKLKSFDNATTLELIQDSTNFELVFDQVLQEVYVFLDKRFVIDSAENVKSKLRKYMMEEMTLKAYVTQDWRFPIVFAYKNKLPPKPIRHLANYQRQHHTMLSEVVMIEEDGEWKVRKFGMVALSRWGEH